MANKSTCSPADPGDDASELLLKLIEAMLAARTALNRLLAASNAFGNSKLLRAVAAAIVGSGATDNSLIETLAHMAKEAVRDEVMANRYVTNDLVKIERGFHDVRKKVWPVWINSVEVGLDRREYILISILASYSRKQWQTQQTLRNDVLAFMPVNAILDAIERLKWQHEKLLRDVWNNAFFNTVHAVVCELRKKLAAAGLNPNLIETGENGAGYRLSTRPINIELDPTFGVSPTPEEEDKRGAGGAADS